MKRKCFKKLQTLSILSVISIMTEAAVYAQQLPAPVITALKQRENSFATMDMTWKVTFKAQYSSVSENNLSTEEMQSSIFQQYRKSGMNADLAQKLASSTARNLSKLRSADIVSSATWEFQRDNHYTTVAGQYPASTGKTSTYKEWFTDNLGVVTSESDPTNTHAEVPTARVWQTAGISTHLRTPVEGLFLVPENFVLLAGFSPLDIYDAEWRLASETPTEWTLQSTAHPPDDSGVRYKITLSREHGGAVSRIEAASEVNPSSQQWQILSFRLYKGLWIGDKVKLLSHAPGIGEVSEVWELQTIKQSPPAHIQLAPKEVVEDYRLLGVNATRNKILDARVKSSHQIVSYKWDGQLPSLEQLKVLYQHQHPGEVALDPGQSIAAPPGLSTPAARASLLASVLPFAGGVLCLVGGVWMFRHYRVK